MTGSILLGLIHNIAILLAFSLLYDYSWVKNEETKRTINKILAGVIIGGLGIILMITPWTFVPGITFDTRSILLSVSGLFFGVIPTLTAMLITTAYRIFLGGDGIWMGIAVIISSGAIGISWKALRPDWKQKNYALELLSMGVVVHAIMLGCTILLPVEMRLKTLKAIALPAIIIYSPGNMLIGMLLVKQFKNWQNRKAKERLLESERRFTEMMESVNLFSIMLDMQGRVTFCNHYFLLITGYSKEEVVGHNWFENFTPPEKANEIKVIFNGLISGSAFYPYYENELIARNKERYLISWNTTLLRSAEGETIGTASIGENVTARRAAERQKLQFANILKASLNEIYLFDKKSLLFKYVNFGALNNLRYTFTEMLTMTPSDIQPDYKTEEYIQLILPLSNHERSVIVYETRNRRVDGSFYPVEVHLQLFEYDDESVFLAIIQDITIRKHIEDQLIESKKKAEESDQLKSIFLANMSHEIRTPLNAIIGFSDLLNKPGISDEKRSFFVGIILNSGNRLLQIINDILDISKLEAKQLKPSLSEFNLFELFSKSITTFNKCDLLQNKPTVSLIANLQDKYKNLKIRSDEGRIRQALDNIISNAIKYTDDGIIEVGFDIKDEDDKQFVEIYIRDSGKGIPAEMHDLIFERFRQIEENAFHEGAGLGLSISKGLIELLGGRVWFTSVENRGTTFFFTIPMVKYNETQIEKEIVNGETVDLRHKTILIAEDDYNSFLYLKELLGSEDVEILYAQNGRILMDMLESEFPDLVLLDINMPEKSGITCLNEIREKKLETKIIVHTAYAMAEERERCFNAGCHGYISKPVTKSQLFRVINQVMKNN